MQTGKLIVIDGTDGSGKATQAQLLATRLEQAGFRVKMADFPQYGKKSAGLVEEYLNGKFGTAKAVGPHRASIFYAIDRYDASFEIKQWLEEGNIVITNRYVTASMGHQGGKIKDSNSRQEFFKWLDELEYGLFGIPRPDINLILHVDAQVAQNLVDQKGHRDYVGGQKRDIHEADIDHLRDAEQVYLELASMFSNFTLIECSPNNTLLDRENISQLIWQTIEPLVKITLPATPIANELLVERISETAKLPTRSHANDAGLDIYADRSIDLTPGQRHNMSTGLRLAIPDGFAGLVWDKSGVANQGLHVLAGVIDAGYRGELLISVINLGTATYRIQAGQKIAQLLIQKVEQPIIIETKIDDETTRGSGGFGSSGLF
ncbi:MAG: dUTP diphosphatase [Candidatus Falkowbacteria bacterium]